MFWIVSGRLLGPRSPERFGKQVVEDIRRPTNTPYLRRLWWSIRRPVDVMTIDGLVIDRTRDPHCAWLGPTGKGKSASVATVRVTGQRPTLIVTPDISDPLRAAVMRQRGIIWTACESTVPINFLIGTPQEVAERLTKVFRSGGVGTWLRAARRATASAITELDATGQPRTLHAIGSRLEANIKSDRELRAACAMWVERFLDLADQFGDSIGPHGYDIADLLRHGRTVYMDLDAFDHAGLGEDIVALGLAEARRCARLVPGGFRLIFEEAGQIGERIELAEPFFRAGRRRRIQVDVLTQAETDLKHKGSDAITSNLATHVYFAQNLKPLRQAAADRLDLPETALAPANMHDFTAWLSHGKIRRLVKFPKPPTTRPYSHESIPPDLESEYPRPRGNRVEVTELWQPPVRSPYAALPAPSIEEQAFLAGFDMTPTCWVWKGPYDKDGYGYATWQGKRAGTHRIMYERTYGIGSIPKGMELDHYACNNRPCGRPEHLEVVDHAENMRRMHARRGHKVKDRVSTAAD